MRILLWLVRYWHGIESFLYAALTPVIAAIAVWIAFQQRQLSGQQTDIARQQAEISRQQYIVNNRQYRLALFSKRLEVFDETMTFVTEVMQRFHPDMQECFAFIRKTRNHEFLFGSDVRDFVNEIFRNATKLSSFNSVIADAHNRPVPLSEDRARDYEKALQESHELGEWFAKQHDRGRTIFRKYMDLSEAL